MNLLQNNHNLLIPIQALPNTLSTWKDLFLTIWWESCIGTDLEKWGSVANESPIHVDGDGMILKITLPPPLPSPLPSSSDKDGKQRTVMFRSRFVETEAMVKERQANRFLYRGTFGTGPSAFFDKRPKNGLNSDPIEPSILSKLIARALNTDIKNSANTQVISFAGKVLALFEAGLPYAIDPETLETLGEDTLGGVLRKGLPVKLGDNIPKQYQPDFIGGGGTAHTAHPNGTVKQPLLRSLLLLSIIIKCIRSCVHPFIADLLVCFFLLLLLCFYYMGSLPQNWESCGLALMVATAFSQFFGSYLYRMVGKRFHSNRFQHV
jgi:hypothetical protein